MTAYTVILNGQLVQDKPVTTTLLTAMRDNPAAIAEGDAAAPRINPVIFHVRDEKSNGTVGGGAISVNVFHRRDINTIVINRITGASLASHQITLPAGTYDIDAFVPGAICDRFRAALYNVTDAAYQNYGSSEYSPASSAGARSHIRGRFTIAAAKVFEVRMAVSAAPGSTTYGVASIFGGNEIYTDVMITKVA